MSPGNRAADILLDALDEKVDHYPAHDLGESPTIRGPVLEVITYGSGGGGPYRYDYMGREVNVEEESPLYDFAIDCWVAWEIFRILHLGWLGKVLRYTAESVVMAGMIGGICFMGFLAYMSYHNYLATQHAAELERKSNEVRQEHIRVGGGHW